MAENGFKGFKITVEKKNLNIKKTILNNKIWFGINEIFIEKFKELRNTHRKFLILIFISNNTLIFFSLSAFFLI